MSRKLGRIPRRKLERKNSGRNIQEISGKNALKNSKKLWKNCKTSSLKIPKKILGLVSSLIGRGKDSLCVFPKNSGMNPYKNLGRNPWKSCGRNLAGEILVKISEMRTVSHYVRNVFGSIKQINSASMDSKTTLQFMKSQKVKVIKSGQKTIELRVGTYSTKRENRNMQKSD